MIMPLLLACAVQAPAPPPATPFPASRWVQLSGHESRKLAGRLAGGRAVAEWTPTPEDLSTLMGHLPSAYAAMAPKGAQPFSAYRLQFGGCTYNGEKVILVNAFTDDMLDFIPDWRRNAIIVFGGGNELWTMTYSVDRQTFSHPQFNTKNGLANRPSVDVWTPRRYYIVR